MAVNPDNPNYLTINLSWYTEPSTVTPTEGREVTLKCKNQKITAPANILEAGSTFIQTSIKKDLTAPIVIDAEPNILHAVLELIRKGTIDFELNRPDYLILLAQELRELMVHPPEVDYEDAVITISSTIYALRSLTLQNVKDIKVTAVDEGAVRANRGILRARSRKLEKDLQRGDIVEFPLGVETTQQLERLIYFIHYGSATLRVWNKEPDSEFEEFCKLLAKFEVVDRGRDGEDRHIAESQLRYGEKEGKESETDSASESEHSPEVKVSSTEGRSESCTEKQLISDVKPILQEISDSSSQSLQLTHQAAEYQLPSQIFPHQDQKVQHRRLPVQHQEHPVQYQGRSVQHQGHPVQHQWHPVQHQGHPVQHQGLPVQRQRRQYHQAQQLQRQEQQYSHESHWSQRTRELSQVEEHRRSQGYPQYQYFDN